MKKTKNFNISVPELGDKPDITQVSNAIQALEDALAGTLEVMTASIQGSALTLTSGARTTKRTKYYEGMAIKFVAPIQINPNSVTTAKVDNLASQTLEIPYLVNAGDSVDIVYKGNKFVGTISAVQRSNAVDSSSTTTVGTSLAVKTAYNKGVDALSKANTAQSTADSKVSKAGDTVTGTINSTAYIALKVTSDEYKDITYQQRYGRVARTAMSTEQVNGVNKGTYFVGLQEADSSDYLKKFTVTSTGIYEDGNRMYSPLNKPSASDVNAVAKSGDTMSGDLIMNNSDIVFSDGHSIRFKPKDGSDSVWAFGTVDNKFYLGESVKDIYIRGNISATGPFKTYGKAFVHAKDEYGASPSKISLAIGDNDTGLNWREDGVIELWANSVLMGYWSSVSFGFHGVVMSSRGENQNGKATNGFKTNFHILGSGGISNDTGVGIGLHEDGHTYFWNNKDGSTDAYTMIVGRDRVVVDVPIMTNGDLTSTGKLKANSGIDTVGLNILRDAVNSGTDDILKITVDDTSARYRLDNSTDGGGGAHIFEVTNSDGRTETVMQVEKNGYVAVGTQSHRVYHQGFKPTCNDICPYRVGDILTTTLPENPAATWVGTIWQKIEGRYLKGTSGSEASKQTGGSMTKTLSVANMPAHNHSASQSAHTHTQPAHTHNHINIKGGYNNTNTVRALTGKEINDGSSNTLKGFLGSAGGDNTGSAQPAITIGNTGSGTAFDIQPSYYTVHYWLRTA